MPGPSRQSQSGRLSLQYLEQEEEEPASSRTDALVPSSHSQPPMPSNDEMRRSIPESINRNTWMSHVLTEEPRRGWLEGAPDSLPASPSGTLAEPLPPPFSVNPTAPGPPEIRTRNAVAIATVPTMPNAASIPPSPSAHVTATGQSDAISPSAPTASSAPDVTAAGDPKPGKRRSTRIAGK